MKKKLLILSILVTLGTQVLANDRNDMKYIDKLYDAKEYSMATDELKDFVVKYPQSSYKKVAINRLAKTLFLNKKYKESKQYFEDYLKIEKLELEEKNDTYYYLSRNNSYLGDFDTARAQINKISKTSPKKEDAVFYLGKTFYDNGDYVNSQKAFKLLIHKPKYKVSSLLYIALASYNNNEYVNSTIYLDEYLKANAKDKDLELANYMYGMNQYKIGDDKKAIEKLVKVETEYPKSQYISNVRISLLTIYLSQENMAKVDEYYKKITNPSNKIKANELIGNYYFENKNYVKAKEYYNKVKDSKNPQTIYGLAKSMYEIGKSDITKAKTPADKKVGEKLIADSKIKFEKLLSTPLKSDGMYHMALIDYNDKNYAGVIKDLKNYKESEMKKEYRGNIDVFLGKSYYEMKNYSKAKVYYEKRYAKSHSKSDLYQLILVESKLGDTKGIAKRFKEYKSKFPTDVEYRKPIYLLTGNTYYRAKDLAKAKATYREYLKSYSDAEISENFITILVAEGGYKELVTYLTPRPKTPENLYLIGVALFGMTEYDKASQEYEKVIASPKSTQIQKEKASYELTRTNFTNKKYDKTIENAKKYLGVATFTKNKYEVMKLEGLANFRLNKYDEARKIFTELGKNKSYKTYSEFQIAETYYNEGKYDLAKKAYNDIYLSDKKGQYAMRSLYTELNIMYIQDDYKNVIEKSKAFKLEYPKSEYLTTIELWRAQSYLKLNDSENAAKTYIEIYANAKETKTKDDAARQLTTLYYNANNFKEADIWRNKISGGSEKVYLSALILEKQGKNEEAIKEYDKLTKDKEYASKSNFNLANIYFKEKKVDEAKKYYENTLGVEGGEYKDTATYQIGQIYLAKKDYSKALRNFMRIELLYDASSLREPSKLKIASIYEAEKNNDKAKQTYEEFYKEYPKSKYVGVALEKLVVINLNAKNQNDAKKYYTELSKVNPTVGKKYDAYFKKTN